MASMHEQSIPGVVAADVAAGRRPRNRKDTIGKVAATMFAERGFDMVRMDDIAAANGITVRALYRHYTNKVALLTAVVESHQSKFVGALEAVDGGAAGASVGDGIGASRYAAVVARLVEVAESTEHFAVLWQRESRHIAPDDYRRLRGRLTSMVRTIAQLIAESSPELTGPQCELRAWATIAAVVVPRADSGAETSLAVATALLGPSRPSDLRAVPIDGGAVAGDEALSRRERLLASAAMSFARVGFASTGIEDIGRAAGVSGPSLYRHFAAKNEILEIAVHRRASWLWYESDRRWISGGDAHARLRVLIDAYVSCAVRAPDLVGIWITESGHVADEVRQSVAGSLAAFQSSWSTALLAARPDLSSLACGQLIRTVIQVIDDTVRIRHLVVGPGFAGELAGLTESILLEAYRGASVPAGG